MKLVKGSASLCLPADKTWVSVGFSKSHTAEDFGHLLKYPASKNQKLVAVSDAVVVQETYYSDGGNTIWIGWTHGDHDYYAGYMHNKEKSNLKIGTKLKQGDPIAIMGKTGTSRGEHVHLVLIKAPKGTPFDNNKLRDYRIAPSSYPMYVYPNQEFKGGEVDIKSLPKPKPTPKPKPKPKPNGLKVGNSVSYEGNVFKDSNGKGKGAKVKGTFKVTILNNNAYGVHLDNLGWVKPNDVKLASNAPQEKPFKPYKFKVKKGAYLYDSKGSRYAKPTTREHQVTIVEENRNLNQGLFKASWLVGVKEAWVKLS